MIVLDKARSIEEIEECIKSFRANNDETFVRTDVSVVLSYFLRTMRENYFRVVRRDDKIIAWIYAVCTTSDRTGDKVVHQIYYGSALKGIYAVRAAVLCHDGMIEFAKRRKAVEVFSQCSYVDTDFKLAKILAKHGWESRGHTSIFRIGATDGKI